MVLLLLRCLLGTAAAPEPATAALEVWYSPHFALADTKKAPPDLFPLLIAAPDAWPQLAARTSAFKLKMQPLDEGNTKDADLAGLAATIKSHRWQTGLEIGGARWVGQGEGARCTAPAQLQYAAQEQKLVSRWMELGGRIDSITTDHALTWDIRHELKVAPCDPPVPMAVRVDAVAQVFMTTGVALSHS
jgi:hypothetical protein